MMDRDSHRARRLGQRTPCYNRLMLVEQLESLPPVETAVEPAPPIRDGWDQVLLIGGSLGVAINLLGAALLAGLAAVTLVSGDAGEALLPTVQGFALLVIAALGVPAIYWGATGRRRRSVERPWPAWILALVLFPLSLGMGTLAFNLEVLPGLFGPAAHVLAAGAPVLFVVSIVLRRGSPLSARRRWGHFLAGLWGSPPLSILVELLALIPTLVVLILGAAASPDLLLLLQSSALGDPSSEAELMQAASDLLSQPLVIAILLGYLALLVPMIEEVLKSITIWPLLRGPLTANQAFVGGALGGAGYALFESLFLAQPGADWLATMLARTGTPLIHAFNTGLVSLGLYMAFKRRKWLRLPVFYGLAVALHGLWNFLALGVGLAGYGIEPTPVLTSTAPLMTFGLVGVAGLFVLGCVALSGLLLLPSRLD